MNIHEKKRLFLRFLKAQNAYPQYLHGLKNNSAYGFKNSYDAEKWCRIKHIYGRSLIVCGFGWEEHKCPNVNWLTLHKLWLRVHEMYEHEYDK